MSRPPFERSEKLSHPDEPGPSHGISEPTARCFRGRLFFGQSQQNAKIFSFFCQELPRFNPARRRGPDPAPRGEARPHPEPAQGKYGRSRSGKRRFLPDVARAGLPRKTCFQLPTRHPARKPQRDPWMGEVRFESTLEEPPSFPVASFGHSILSSFLPLNLSRPKTRNSHVGVRCRFSRVERCVELDRVRHSDQPTPPRLAHVHSTCGFAPDSRSRHRERLFQAIAPHRRKFGSRTGEVLFFKFARTGQKSPSTRLRAGLPLPATHRFPQKED